MKSDKDIINREESRNFAIAAIKSIRKIGYQCRLTLFDSRSFGSPQNRLRLFIICARRGVLLPSNPEPSHTNPAITINLFTSADMEQQPRAFFVGTKGVQGSAPYPAVTVRDAISDLPPFEYEHRQPVVSARSVPRFDASGQPGDRVGFDGAVEHASGAKNDYQTSQRRGATQVFDHYTPARSARLLGL
jgi:site-specific DNA-cytosine methylase